MSDGWTSLETDLLVIGGGVAGSMAAIPALEAGLSVVVCDKGQVLDNCGSVGCGVDHYLTVMDSGPDWDTPSFLIRHVPDLTDGIVDLAVASRVIQEMPRIFRKIEGLGVNFRDPRLNDYYRVRSFGLPGAYHINFDGTGFKRTLGKHVRKRKSTILMRTMAVQLLVEDNRVYGALAFNYRSGAWYAIRARAVMLATGDVNRISKNASGLAFDSWHFPYNTGDAQAMGYRVGAQLANMEFVEATLTPKGFSSQGLNAVVSLEAHFLNVKGERFMFKYDPKGENARRAVLVDGVINEYLEGNGPIYLDLRHLPGDVIDHIESTLQIDRYTMPAFYRQKGIDFRRDLIEIAISELSIRRSGVYFRGSGLAVDVNGETSVEALFAGGDCATVSGGISGAAVLGHIAGEGAVARIRRTQGALPAVDMDEARRLRAEKEAHLHRSEGPRWQELEDRARATVSDYVGVRRTRAGLERAIATLRGLAAREPEVKVDNLHGLARVEETKNIRQSVEIMATAALLRTETRTRSAHRRLDHPEPDDARWHKMVVVEQGTDGPLATAVDASRPLSDAFARTSKPAA
jgi:adenylylsulfate reductase, subunit A